MPAIDDRKNMKLPNLTGVMLAAGAIIGALEILSPSKGSLLLLLTYWTAVVEGSIALVAAAELSNAKWIQPVKLKLLVLYYMIPFLALLFLLMFMRMGIYPWMDHQTRWLNKNFFMSRNLFLFLIIFAAARKFVVSSVEERESKKKYAVLYLLAFVCAQSFVAFDWVMPLEYPWISTLFGGFFFVEAVY